MMRELKILAVVVFFTGAIYWGVEPFAHSQMHKHVEGDKFEYTSLKEVAKGDVSKGAEAIASCIGCHSINSQGMSAPMDAVSASGVYGVNPPDLSNAGVIYDEKYLAAFIKNPAKAAKVSHKFSDTKLHPMYSDASMMGITDQNIVDIVAYLKSIAKDDLTPKQVYVDACGRCHAVRYDNKVMGEKWTQIGQKPKFKYLKDSLAYDIKVIDYQENLKKYMGKLPPDLSMIIRARSNDFLETFIENPQSQLNGTAMPAVGLNKESYEKVMQHLENVGDPSKPVRETMGLWFLLYFAIFAVLATLWKKSVWKKLH
jgi:ubiquinol-cytochrome c reductase cytochrome c1 subunit